MALGITELVSHGVVMVGPNASPEVQPLLHFGNWTRLFPSSLKTLSRRGEGGGTYASRLGFRMVYLQADEHGVLNDPYLDAWAVLGGAIYGQRTIENWVFELGEDGKAVAVEARMLRLKLIKEF
ncbi:hypothetical protein GQ53DRAFT_847866 [Thozetella sp. PMI_491]|nr:hypothetical protein GQ53DRAFT_847866 [Thozetella sp. PMI_491]